MGAQVLRRVLGVVPVLIGVSIVVFAILRMVPGDPVVTLYGAQGASPAEMAALRSQLGLDQPLPVQYAAFVTRALRGDFGTSIMSNRPVAKDLLNYTLNTFQLALVAFVMAVAVGGGLGLLAAFRPYSWLDNLAFLISLIGISLPIYWLGLLLIWIFAVGLNLFPSFGKETPQAFVLPAITLAMPSIAVIARLVRASSLEIRTHDFVRTARGKGLSDGMVMTRHVLPNALLPVVTVMGLQLGYMLAGAVLTETIFAWPGLGRYVVDAINSRDYPVVQAAVLLIATFFAIINLIIDLMYGFIDPRLRTGGEGL